jgi:hypothetical protein
MGNVLIQAMGAGELSGLSAVREIVRRSSSLETFTPRPTGDWDRAYKKFREVTRH